MKLSYLIPAILISAIAVDVSAQQRGKDKGEQAFKWRVQLLHKDDNKGIAVGDIEGDRKLNITSGEFWYQAPDFKQRPVRELTAFGDDYLSNNSEHLYDMDGVRDLLLH